MILIIIAGLLLAPGDTTVAAPAGGDSAMGLILVFVLLTFGGWNEAVYITAEVREPSRWMPRILVLSLVVISLLYLLINLAYLRVLGMGGMAGSEAVAADWYSR